MTSTDYLADADRLITEAWSQPLDQLRASTVPDPVLTGVLRLRQELASITTDLSNQQAGVHRLTEPGLRLDDEGLRHLSCLTEQLRAAHSKASAYRNAIATLLHAFPQGYLGELHLLRAHHHTNTASESTPAQRPGPAH
ncbi:hypothetical protein [Streptomyces sp. NPDC051561]|uniref:hypothetical protein n=1 Tax=Streptomyces sp. NPDC051561 TaxID=3365658 RepID=UPI0037BADCE9